jgi:glyoxylase-like metal-dependent hydrolase (beta-lactamase superfamily II)
MRRFLLGLLILAGTLGGAAWWVLGHLEATQLASDVWVYSGVGGNVGVLVTQEGAVVVDTMMLVHQGDVIRARVRELTDKPIAAVLNTHYHFDHTHGNPAFPAGTKVISTAKTLQHLNERDADFWKERPAHDLLPNDTFDGPSKELRIGGKTIRSYFFGRGHTDGDMVVLFVEDRVLHAGDLFFNGHYPNIDLEAGGSVKLWAATLDKVLALPFDTVIPGHGPPTTRRSLERFRDFMASLWTQTVTIHDRGGSVEDAIQLVDIDQFGLKPIWFVPTLNRGFVIRRAWQELTGSPKIGS